MRSDGTGNLLATTEGDLVYLDFGMMSEAPQHARYAIIAHVVHLVNRDYPAMCKDYYTLDFMDRSVDTTPIAPALANFFDDVLDQSVAKLNFKVGCQMVFSLLQMVSLLSSPHGLLSLFQMLNILSSPQGLLSSP